MEFEIEEAGVLTDQDWDEIHTIILANGLDRPASLASLIALGRRSLLYVARLRTSTNKRARIVGLVSLSITQSWGGEIGHRDTPLIASEFYESDLGIRLIEHVESEGEKRHLVRIDSVYPPADSLRPEPMESPPPSIH